MQTNWHGTQRRRRAERGDQGVALMIVLLFILLLSVIVTEFAYEIQVEASLATNTNRDAQAYIAAKSAVASGMGLLRADLMADAIMNNSQTGTYNPRQQAQQQNRNSQSQQYAGQEGMGDYDGLTDVWAQGVPNQMLNDATMQCTITDEYGKLNLNALITEDGQENETLVTALRTLFANLGLEKDPTDAILDWLDSDDDPRPDGAESDVYEGLETPYSCKNGQMNSIEELLLIADIPAEFYFDALIYVRGDGGTTNTTNRTGTSNRSSKTAKSSSNPKSAALGQQLEDEEMRPVSLADLLTVHGDPTGAVNVNTAHPELLTAMLDSMSQGNGANIDEILMQRLEDPFHTVQDFYSRAGVSAPNVQQGNGVNQQNKTSGTAQNSASGAVSAPKAASLEPGSKQFFNGANTTGTDLQTKPGQQPNTVTNPNGVNTQQAQGPFSVRSDVFRIFGDGQSGDVMVRIEAYVFRVNDMNGMDGANGVMNGGAANNANNNNGSNKQGPEKAASSNSSGSNNGRRDNKNTNNAKNNNASKSEFGLKGPASGQAAMETFRILDWRVIR